MGDVELLVRNSERGDFMRCKQKWWWAYGEGITPKVSAPALRFGTLIHLALEAYYRPQSIASWKKHGPRRGPHPAKSFALAYEAEVEKRAQEFNIHSDDDWVDAKELGIEMMNNYVAEYGKDEHLRIVQPEQTFAVDVCDEEGTYVYTAVGTMDLVAQDMRTTRYGIVDHKTAANLGTDHLALDEQASTYWAFAPYVWPQYEFDWMMFNIMRKAKADQRKKNDLGQYLNKDGSVSKNQPAPLFHRQQVFRSDEDRRSLIKRSILQVQDMQRYRSGELEVYKSPMHGCTGMFGCQFKDMCELHESGADWESYRDGMFTTWDPYADHGEEK